MSEIIVLATDHDTNNGIGRRSHSSERNTDASSSYCKDPKRGTEGGIVEMEIRGAMEGGGGRGDSMVG